MSALTLEFIKPTRNGDHGRIHVARFVQKLARISNPNQGIRIRLLLSSMSGVTPREFIILYNSLSFAKISRTQSVKIVYCRGTVIDGSETQRSAANLVVH